MGCGPCGCTDDGRGDAGCRRFPDGDLEDAADEPALPLLLPELLLEGAPAPPPLPLLALLLPLPAADETLPWLLPSLLGGRPAGGSVVGAAGPAEAFEVDGDVELAGKVLICTSCWAT